MWSVSFSSPSASTLYSHQQGARETQFGFEHDTGEFSSALLEFWWTSQQAPGAGEECWTGLINKRIGIGHRFWFDGSQLGSPACNTGPVVPSCDARPCVLIKFAFTSAINHCLSRSAVSKEPLCPSQPGGATRSVPATLSRQAEVQGHTTA